MSYRRFRLPEMETTPATLATLATVRLDTPPSVANVASVAGHIPEITPRAPVPFETGQDWSAEEWQVFFDERAGIAEFDGGLPRPEAEAYAFECCVVAWLNRHPVPSEPGRCAWCGKAESLGAVVLPFGTEPGTHTWLHAECWAAWQEARRGQAVKALALMGINPPVPSTQGRGLKNPRATS
jgi:hypothetical protein